MSNNEENPFDTILSVFSGIQNGNKQKEMVELSGLGNILGLASAMAGKAKEKELPSIDEIAESRIKARDPIDWEQRRFELVKVVFPMFTNAKSAEWAAEKAVETADIIIKYLKK